MTADFGESMGNAFGTGVTGGWGEAGGVAEDAGEALPGGGETRFNSGVFKIDEAKWRALLHHPWVVDAVMQRAQDICDAANSLVAIDPRTVARLEAEDPGPAYEIMLQNRPDTARVRAQVRTAGLLGMLDQMHNGTLLKAYNTYPSDPKPGIAPNIDAAQPPDQLEATMAAIREIAAGYTRESVGEGIEMFSPESGGGQE